MMKEVMQNNGNWNVYYSNSALTMGLLENILPAFFVYLALGIILVDVVVIIILGNTLCRK